MPTTGHERAEQKKSARLRPKPPFRSSSEVVKSLPSLSLLAESDKKPLFLLPLGRRKRGWGDG
jgi:hypothetical protein